MEVKPEPKYKGNEREKYTPIKMNRDLTYTCHNNTN